MARWSNWQRAFAAGWCQFGTLSLPRFSVPLEGLSWTKRNAGKASHARDMAAKLAVDGPKPEPSLAVEQERRRLVIQRERFRGGEVVDHHMGQPSSLGARKPCPGSSTGHANVSIQLAINSR